MKKVFPFHQFLFAVFPVLSLYSANMAFVPQHHLIRPLLITLVAAGLAWLLLSAVFRSWERGAVGASVLMLLLFGFSLVARWLTLQPTSTTALFVWGVIAIFVTPLAALKLNITRFLNVLSVFLVLVASVQIAVSDATGVSSRRSPSWPAAKTQGERPDIFYIVLDGYGRSDALKRTLGYDNSWFIRGLRERGFFVADESVSNYVQTELSVTSSLNLDYVQNLVPDADPNSYDRSELRNLLDKSTASEFLRAQGYEFVGVSTGFPPLRFGSADVRYDNGPGVTLFEAAVLGMTPLGARGDTVDSLYEQRRQHLKRAFRDLESLAVPGHKPRFVVAHIVAPHPPFVFGPNGEEVTTNAVFTFMDGSHYLEKTGTEEQYRERFAGQTEYISKLTLQMVDALLERDRKPILILQGDHGSKLHLHQESLEQTDLNEVLPILNAYYVPEEVHKQLRPDITPVNTFRVLFRELFGADYPNLPSRSYYAPWSKPYDLTDVTDRLGQ